MALSVVKRDLISTIIEGIEHKSNSLIVYFVQARGGTGKTMMARQLGRELGSPDGNGPYLNEARKIAYSGNLDLYDLDTNTNPGLESRLIAAYSKPREAFADYFEQRSFYQGDYKLGVTGSQLEQQRKKVADAFAYGLKQVCLSYYPVIVFDTVERLDIAVDPLQEQYQLINDTATVAGWICDQITRLSRGTIVILGRPGLNSGANFKEQLKVAIQKANLESGASRETEIEFVEPSIDNFTPQESELFFADRAENYPHIKEQLRSMRNDLYKKYGGNPLFLDLAILSLEKSRRQGREVFEKTQKEILNDHDLQQIGQSLINSYWTLTDNVEQKTVLDYLAAAKNGLSKRLVKFLSKNEPDRLDIQLRELEQLEKLPFIKSRNVTLQLADEHQEELEKKKSASIFCTMKCINSLRCKWAPSKLGT